MRFTKEQYEKARRDIADAAVLDDLAHSYRILGVDLGFSTDVTTIATVQDGRIVDVRNIRRPWKLTGRAATRARWRRRGRR